MLQMKLIDDGDLKNAKDFGEFVQKRLHKVSNKRLDPLAAKSVYFLSVAYERLGELASSELRQMLFASLKDCTLHHNSIGQATIMNIIIRSYLSQNLYEQARHFIAWSTFPETASNNQYARYLYYVGKIKAVQMEYSEA